MGIIAAQINEVEAYIGRMDKASHAYNYKCTERTKVMFETGGIAYVYFIYGKYFCLNVVTEKKGEPSAVLIRGAQVVEGMDAASYYRYSKPYEALSNAQKKNISNGPGKLCMAMNITKEQNGLSLFAGELVIAENRVKNLSDDYFIKTTKRIGIDYAEEAIDFEWRFVLEQK